MPIRKTNNNFKINFIKFILAIVFVILSVAFAIIVESFPILSEYDLQLTNFCVILCGIICGGPLGFFVGIASPFTQFFVLTDTFESIEIAIMCVQLCIIGYMSGYLYKAFKKSYIYSLVNVFITILIGLITNISIQYIISMSKHNNIDFKILVQTNIYPLFLGIIIELLFIPLLIHILQKSDFKIMK